MNRTDAEREQRAALFLARLERLCHLEDRFVSPPDVVTDPHRLVCKAIFSTYCDCLHLGRKVEADRLLAAARPARLTMAVSPTPEPQVAR